MAALLIELDQHRRDNLMVALAAKNITTSAFATPKEAQEVLDADPKAYRVVLFGTSMVPGEDRRNFIHHVSHLVDADVRVVDYGLHDRNMEIVQAAVKAHPSG